MKFKSLLIGSIAFVSAASPIASYLTMPKMVQNVLNTSTNEKQETPKYDTSNLGKWYENSAKTSDDAISVSLIRDKTKSIKFDSDSYTSTYRLDLRDKLLHPTDCGWQWSIGACNSGFDEPTFDGVGKISFQSNQHTDERVIYTKLKVDYAMVAGATCNFTTTFNVDILGWHNNHFLPSYLDATIQLFELKDENDEPEYISQYPHDVDGANIIQPCVQAFETWKFNHKSMDWFNVSWPHRQYESVKKIWLENNSQQNTVISKYYGVSLAISGVSSSNANTQVHMDLNVSSVSHGRKESPAQAEINYYKALINAGTNDYLNDKNLSKEDLEKRYDIVKKSMEEVKKENPDTNLDPSLMTTKEDYVSSLTTEKEKGKANVIEKTNEMIEKIIYFRRQNAHGWLKTWYSINDKIGARASSETFTDALIPFNKLNERIENGESLNSKSLNPDYSKIINNGQLHYEDGDNFISLNTQFHSKSKTFYFPFKVSIAFPNNINLSYKLSTAWQAEITNYVMGDIKPDFEPKYSVQLFNFGEDENATPTNFYGLYDQVDSKNVDNYCFKNWVQDGGKFDEYKASSTDLLYHPSGESNPENGSFAYTFWNEGNKQEKDIVKNIYFGLLIHQESNQECSFGDMFKLKSEVIDLSECITQASTMGTSFFADSNKNDKVMLSDMKPGCENGQYEVTSGNGGVEFKPTSKNNDLRAVYSRNRFKTWLPAHSEASYGCNLNARSVFERGDNLTAWTYTIKNNISLFDLGNQEKPNPSFIPNRSYNIETHKEEAKENNLISSVGHELHGSADVAEIIFLTIKIAIDVILIAISIAQIAKVFKAFGNLKNASSLGSLNADATPINGAIRKVSGASGSFINFPKTFIHNIGSKLSSTANIEQLQHIIKTYLIGFVASFLTFVCTNLVFFLEIKNRFNVKTNVNYLYSKLEDGDKIMDNIGSFNFVVRNDSDEDKFVYHDFAIGYVHDGQRSQETPTNSTTIVYMDFKLCDLKKINTTK